MPRTADQSMFVRRLAICVVSSLILMVLSLVFGDSDLGAVLCFGIALVSALLLFAFSIAKKGRQRLIAFFVVVVYVFVPILLLSNYSLVRDHARWFLLSGGYKAKVLAQPSNGQLKHAEWDGWGFAGVANTTAFLVFDPTDSLAVASGALPPVKARGLPCEVFRVRRLDRQWYAVLFYSDTYWGQGGCK
jgi:hypothetical protein